MVGAVTSDSSGAAGLRLHVDLSDGALAWRGRLNGKGGR